MLNVTAIKVFVLLSIFVVGTASTTCEDINWVLCVDATTCTSACHEFECSGVGAGYSVCSSSDSNDAAGAAT